MLYALNQKDFLDAVIGDPEYYKVCKAMFMCGGPYETTAGFADKYESDFDKAKVLLKEGGYEGASSMIYYGRPTVWGPSIEEDIVKAVREQVKKVRE